MKPLTCLLATLISFSAQPVAAAEDPPDRIVGRNLDATCDVAVVGELLITTDKSPLSDEKRLAVRIIDVRQITRGGAFVVLTNDQTEIDKTGTVLSSLPDSKPLIDRLTSWPETTGPPVASFQLCLARRTFGQIIKNNGQVSYREEGSWTVATANITYREDYKTTDQDTSSHRFREVVRVFEPIAVSTDCTAIWIHVQGINHSGIAWGKGSGWTQVILTDK